MSFENFLRGRLRHALTNEELEVLESLVESTEYVSEQRTILHRGDVVDYSTILIEGFALRTIRDHSGKRHVVGVQVSGDFADLHAFALKRLDHNLVTVGGATLGYVPHERLKNVLEEMPHLTRILWFSTLLDAAIHREWIWKLEQLNTEGCLAHLILEIWYRLDFVGLAEPSGFNFPLTQIDLADACGATAVHMNRTIRKMRSSGLMDINRGRVTLLDIPGLQELAKYDPTYLYGKGDLMVGHELDWS
ncbi:Crp/Fnr family transcriptional regulator [uncultured Roseibium sp.]|uniref:Crp/Fnr family transcriptional regulator n=1 Tax=uncultured Roseibium sp. TaxID=1936171 RepID=UPI003216A0DD